MAHPVSFVDATSLMSYNRENENEILLTYTLKNYFAVGLTYNKIEAVDFTVPRLDFLLRRWNNEDSQANIYISGGYGYERSFHETKPVSLASAEMDWESRKYYASAEYDHYFRDRSGVVSRQDFEESRVRVGIAPYLAEFNELNSWLILEEQKMPDQDWQTGAYIRLFYKNVMTEVGTVFGQGMAFNFMVHF